MPKKPLPPRKRETAILVRCTRTEKQAIMEAAEKDRRTLGAFMLLAAMERVERMERVEQQGG